MLSASHARKANTRANSFIARVEISKPCKPESSLNFGTQVLELICGLPTCRSTTAVNRAMRRTIVTLITATCTCAQVAWSSPSPQGVEGQQMDANARPVPGINATRPMKAIKNWDRATGTMHSQSMVDAGRTSLSLQTRSCPQDFLQIEWDIQPLNVSTQNDINACARMCIPGSCSAFRWDDDLLKCGTYNEAVSKGISVRRTRHVHQWIACISTSPQQRPPVPPLSVPLLRTGWWDLHPRQQLSKRIKNTSRIAVVGSSGNLLGSSLGPFIDSHDVIIRFNGAFTKGYERDVGTRTHIRIGWEKGFVDARSHLSRGEWLLYSCPLSKSCRWGSNESLMGHQGDVLNDAMAVWAKEHLLNHIRGWPSRGLPSTGFKGLLFALAAAQRMGAKPPSVFGFGSCRTCCRYFDCNSTQDPTSAKRGGASAEKLGSDFIHPNGRETVIRTGYHLAGTLRLFESTCE